MKNNIVTDDFFYTVVNHSGTAYVLQIKDRAAFIAFGNENLSTNNKIFKFVRDKIVKKYDIRQDNSEGINEKGFVKMLEEPNAGVEIFKSTDNTYTDYKKLKIENNQVVGSSCN